MKYLCLIFIVVILSACASKPPAPISKTPVERLTLAEVRAEPGRFIGTEVRWGGVITRVENKEKQTWIEVVSRELRKDGEPKLDGKSEGRFIASFSGFADPVVYEAGHLLTVLGTIEQQATRLIGEYEYTFPVVTVTGSYLWRVEPQIRFPGYPPPWNYHPWPRYPRAYPHPYPHPYPFYPW